MTIDLQVRRVNDVFVRNDVFNLNDRGGIAPPELRIAAVEWSHSSDGHVRNAHREALDVATSLVATRLPNHELWLLAGHSATQPKTRVTQFRKLWGALQARGIPKPFGRDVAEGVIERDGGVRYFSAVQLGLGQIAAAAAVLEAENASHLVVIEPRREPAIKALIDRGWDRPPFGPDLDVLVSVCSNDGLVLWPTGSFDDAEAGVVALAKPDLIEKLVGP